MAVNLGVEWLLSGLCCLGSEFLWGKIVQVQEHMRPSFPGLLCLCRLMLVPGKGAKYQLPLLCSEASGILGGRRLCCRVRNQLQAVGSAS